MFGPLSLKALREDVAQSAADGFAGGAEVVFLDEIFRARALLPALLQLLNERTWPDGSRNRPARLVSAVAATNALRDADDDDDDALFDRFLFRRAVAPVSDAGALDLLLTPTDADEGDDDCALLAPLSETQARARDSPAPPRRGARVLQGVAPRRARRVRVRPATTAVLGGDPRGRAGLRADGGRGN